MNHTRFCIVLLAGNRDDGVMPLMFVNRRGESFVKIVCTCADRRSTAGAAASFGLDGSDVMDVTRRIASGSGLSRRGTGPAWARELP